MLNFLCILFLKNIAFISASKRYIKFLFLYILGFHSFYISPLNAKCVCKCVNKKVEIICKKDSDVKPICMPYACDNGLIEEIPKISLPEPAKAFKNGCEGSASVDLSGDKIILREKCQ